MTRNMQPVIRRALDRRAIRSGDLPAFDLYMDQIISLVESAYAANRRTEQEKLLTKTMINNYSKEGLIRPVRGKKYSPEHIVQMLAIYTLKGTLSIGEIRGVLQSVYAQDGFDAQRLSDCYEAALDCREAQLPALEQLLAEVLSQAGDCDTQDGLLSALLTVAALSDALRCAAEALFDEHFASPTPAGASKRTQKKKRPE